MLARRTGAVAGVVITGLLFGLIHSPQYGYSWAAVLIICLVGAVLTTVRAVTKSVASSFLVHVGYNPLAGREIRRSMNVKSSGGPLKRYGACKIAKNVLLQPGFGSKLRFHL